MKSFPASPDQRSLQTVSPHRDAPLQDTGTVPSTPFSSPTMSSLSPLHLEALQQWVRNEFQCHFQELKHNQLVMMEDIHHLKESMSQVQSELRLKTAHVEALQQRSHQEHHIVHQLHTTVQHILHRLQQMEQTHSTPHALVHLLKQPSDPSHPSDPAHPSDPSHTAAAAFTLASHFDVHMKKLIKCLRYSFEAMQRLESKLHSTDTSLRHHMQTVLHQVNSLNVDVYEALDRVERVVNQIMKEQGKEKEKGDSVSPSVTNVSHSVNHLSPSVSPKSHTQSPPSRSSNKRSSSSSDPPSLFHQESCATVKKSRI